MKKSASPLIHLSTSEGGVKNTKLKNRKVRFSRLAEVLSEPKVGEKDGSYFTRGPVNKTCIRADKNIIEANLLILDCDSAIDLGTKETSEGAPPSILIHNLLKELNILHHIYTTHSHGEKGNRYRVVIPPDRPLKNTQELKVCVDSLFDIFHSNGINLNCVKENYAWSQPWFRPRIPHKGAQFECYTHNNGQSLSVEKCIEWADVETPDVNISVDINKLANITPDSKSIIEQYNNEHGDIDHIVNFLTERGYLPPEGGTNVNEKGQIRLIAPNSTSQEAGVVILKGTNGKVRVYSHHGSESDPLANFDQNGKRLAHDAFDVYRILVHGGDLNAAIHTLRPQKTVINVTGGSNSENVQQAIKALAVKPYQVFQRGHMLCRVAHLPNMNGINDCSSSVSNVVIVVLTPHDLLIRLGDLITWQRTKYYKGEPVEECIDPPLKVAQGILASQGDWHGIPSLKAIIETPIFRNDGSLHDFVGYDSKTGLYYSGGCPNLSVPLKPSIEDAKSAASRIKKVFRQFPFVNKKIDLSVVIAYIFTLILRGQISLAPLFAVSATIPGSGKGLLIEICNIIVRGRDAAIMPAVSGGSAEEEMRKRITAMLLQAVNSVNLDNWETPIGGEALNGLLTANEWSDRVLGKSEAVKLPNRVTWAATGNNLVVRGDMVRRTLLIQLAPQVERPELREFKISNLPQHVTTHRAELLSDAFTILRAYLQAGRPLDDQPALGRFEEWWKAVCAPIVWLGLPDPVQSQEQLRKDDPELSKLQRLLHAWHNLLKDKPVTVAELARRVKDFPGNKPKLAELHEALLECSSNQQGNINTRSLGWYLKRFTGRIVSSLQLERVDSSSKVPEYRVVAAVTK